MKRYKLKKDLPTFKVGEEFTLAENGNLIRGGNATLDYVVAYARSTLENFPNILTEWFEEIPEKPKTVWDLKDGDIYFVLCDNGSILNCTWCEDHGNCQVERTCGSCFLTREEAKKELARRKAKVILERDTKGFKPDWSSGRQPKLIVFYDYEAGELMYESWSRLGYGVPCFPDEASVERSIEEHSEEWLIYLGVENSDETE